MLERGTYPGLPGPSFEDRAPGFAVTAQVPTGEPWAGDAARVPGGTPKSRHGAAAAFSPRGLALKCQLRDTSLAGRKGKRNGLSDRGKDRRRCLDDVTKEGRGRLFVQLWGV